MDERPGRLITGVRGACIFPGDPASRSALPWRLNAPAPEAMMTARTALIVGAGIGGLAAGLALRRSGWRVRIFEQAPTARELGFALRLAPNAMAALRELGIDEVVAARAARPTTAEIRHPNGRVLRRLYVKAAGPSLVVLRAALHGALLEAVGDDALQLASEAVSFSTGRDGVTLELRDGRSVDGAVLIGADGVNSVVRRILHPGEAAPRASGYCAVRGVATAETDFLSSLSAVAYLGDGVEAAAAWASSSAVYWYLSLLLREIPEGERDPRRIAERWTKTFETGFRRLVASTEADAMRFDVLLQRSPIPHWGAGPVTLLGDAAHPMLPHTGQGAAQSLEDAVALGLALSRPMAPGNSLRDYERVRSRRTDRFVRLGPRIAGVTTTRNSVIKALRTLLIRAMPERILTAEGGGSGADPWRELRDP